VVVSDQEPVLFLIDTKSERVTETVPLKDVPKPAQIARYAPDWSLLAVTRLNSDTVSLISPSFREQTAVKVGSQPMDMVYRGDELFVACQGDGSVHVIDIPGIAIGIGIGALMQLGLGYAPDLMLSQSLIDSIAGAVIGASLLFAIALAYRLVRKIEGMGLGDVKMIAMLGAVLGWEPLFPLLVIASVIGAVVGGVVAANSDKGMQAAVPFGVFLGLAALVMLFFGPTLWSWYLALLLR